MKIIAILLALAALLSVSASSAPKPNIVILYVDDMGFCVGFIHDEFTV